MTEQRTSAVDRAALLSLQQLMDQAAPPKDILQFIAKKWPQDAPQIIDKAAKAYKLAREVTGSFELEGFDAQFSPSSADESLDDQSFPFYALLGKAICGKLPDF